MKNSLGYFSNDDVLSMHIYIVFSNELYSDLWYIYTIVNEMSTWYSFFGKSTWYNFYLCKL